MFETIVKKIHFNRAAISSSVFVFSFVIILLESYHQLGEQRVTTDFVSWALSGLAPVFKIGFPYIDYWGINPPGVLLFTAFWGILVGYSLHSFHILYILLISSEVYFIWHFLRKVFSPIESGVIFFIFCITFFSNLVQSQFFPSEINGLFFTLLGLSFCFEPRIKSKQLFFSAFCFIFAGQMKEVFAFGFLALFPHFIYSVHLGRKKIIQFLTFTALGALAALAILILYLILNHALLEYIAILDYKSTQFSFGNMNVFGSNFLQSIQYPFERFIYLQYNVILVLLIAFISTLLFAALKAKVTPGQIKISFPKKILEYTVLLSFCFGSLIGSALQGRYGNKYEIQSIFPSLTLLAISLKVILHTSLAALHIKPNKLFGKIVFILLLGVFLFPKKYYFLEQYLDLKNYSVSNHITMIRDLENDKAIRLEKYLHSKTSDSDCITAVYGWGIGSHYYYSQRQSCSRHFLVNILTENFYDEYRKELVENPPKAIIYSKGWADLDTDRFEKTIFDFPKVIAQCYSQDTEFSTLYWRKNTAELTSACILENHLTKTSEVSADTKNP